MVNQSRSFTWPNTAYSDRCTMPFWSMYFVQLFLIVDVWTKKSRFWHYSSSKLYIKQIQLISDKNAQVLNTFVLSRFLKARLPGGSYCMRLMWYIFAAVYSTSSSRNFTAYSCRGPGSPQFLYRGPQICKNCDFLPKLTAFCALPVVRMAEYFCRLW